MLVVGVETIFLSHLPMFMSPHHYQVILQGTFSQPGSDPQRIYREDRRSHPSADVYTFDPSAFILPHLFPPAPKRNKIRGKLFRGHFEGPLPEFPGNPVQIAAGVDVNVINVVYFQKLIPHPAATDSLEYLMFGQGEELYLAHIITRPPDFDHIVSARVTGHTFRDEELRLGIRIRCTGRTNSAAQRLTAGKAVPAVVQIADKKVSLEVEPRTDIYMMERELAQMEHV